MDKQSMHKSWLLSNCLERFIGSKREIFARRRNVIWSDFISESDDYCFHSTGSKGEGFEMKGSDTDCMSVMKNILVLDPSKNHQIPLDTTVIYIQRTNCRPGYVLLELRREGRHIHNAISKASVEMDNTTLLSSEIFREHWNIDQLKEGKMLSNTTSGPCCSLLFTKSTRKLDIAFSLFSPSWPSEASEWVTRQRFYGWPPKHVIDEILSEGCHLVPVGDKTSSNTFLQWRISFATAERKLVYSLTYLQFKVYGLLKYILKQTESKIEAKTDDKDILCSYFLKTIIFYAVENSPSSLWQEKYTFVCFMHCLNLLIDWVNSAYCPNYFIPTNNMFLRKVRAKNRRELLNILVDLRESKWACLSVRTFFTPSIGELLQRMDEIHPFFLSLRREKVECSSDMETYSTLFLNNLFEFVSNKEALIEKCLNKLANLLSQSQSDEDEAVCYCKIVSVLATIAKIVYCEHFGGTNNKETYITIRKCKRLLTPMANMCVSPGQLLLATFFYNTGNYDKTLDLCLRMTYSPEILTDIFAPLHDLITYEKRYCGKGHSFYHKCKEGCVTILHLSKDYLIFYPSQLYPEISSVPIELLVPPLPYAIFLSFLCYYDLGILNKCHEALEHLNTVCVYDERQAGEKYWIVYNLLAICCQLIGDNEMAMWACRESLRVMPTKDNFALERLKTLQSE